MRKLPDINFVAVWNGLPARTRDAIGVLVIKEAVLRFAADTYQGDEPATGVAYLTASGRKAAEREADEIAVQLAGMIQTDLPDLFGKCPSAEHPNGTDPTWAKPMPFRIRPSPPRPDG